MVGIRCCTLYLSHVTTTSNGLGPYTYALFRQDKIDVRFTTMTAMDSGILAINSALNSLSPIRCGGGEKKKLLVLAMSYLPDRIHGVALAALRI